MNRTLQIGKGRLTWPLAISLLAIVLVAGAIWLGYPKSTASNSASAITDVARGAQSPGEESGAGARTSEAGEVKIVVEWQGKEAGPAFKVTMDTHSLELDDYDLTRLATLRTSDGRETLPLTWDAPKGGHHREGTLTFSGNALDGKPLIGPNTKRFELIIYEVAGVAERSFEWTP